MHYICTQCTLRCAPFAVVYIIISGLYLVQAATELREQAVHPRLHCTHLAELAIRVACCCIAGSRLLPLLPLGQQGCILGPDLILGVSWACLGVLQVLIEAATLRLAALVSACCAFVPEIAAHWAEAAVLVFVLELQHQMLLMHCLHHL